MKTDTRIAISKDCKGQVDVWILRRDIRLVCNEFGFWHPNESGATSVQVEFESDKVDLKPEQMLEMTVEQFALFAIASLLSKGK